MRDLFRPINKDNKNQNIEYEQQRKESNSMYKNIDIYIECKEEDIYDLYYPIYIEQCEREAFIEEMEIIGLLMI